MIEKTVGETEYRFEQVGRDARTRLNTWMKAEFMRALYDSVRSFPHGEKSMAMETGQRVASSLTFGNDEANEVLRTPDGQAKLLYESLRRTMPSVTNQLCHELVESGEVDDVIDELLEGESGE